MWSEWAEISGDDARLSASSVLISAVDRLGVLQELYEKEVALREACRKYIDTLLLAWGWG